MDFDNWHVDLFGPWPNPNNKLSPYTGLPIDPAGITQSLFWMTLTHIPTGNKIERADLTSDPSPEFLKRYAQDVASNAERHMTHQKPLDDIDKPVPVKLDITNPKVVDSRSPDQVAIDQFQVTVNKLIDIKEAIDGGLNKAITQTDYDTMYATIKGEYSEASAEARPTFDKIWSIANRRMTTSSTVAL